jgi:hypothetical protein
MASVPGSSPLLRQKCLLTACRSVSCYGVSVGGIALVVEGPVKMGRLRRMNALLLGLESCC